MLVRIVSAVVSGALVGGVLVPPVWAAPLADQQTADATVAVPEPPTKQGSMTPAPPLVVQVQQFSPGRVRGVGKVQAIVMRRQADGKKLRNVQVRLSSSSSVARVVSGQGQGWKCSQSKGELTCTRKSLAAGLSPGSLFADVKIAGKVPSRQVKVDAEVTWANMGQFRAPVGHATSSKKKSKKSKKSTARVSLVRDSGPLDVYPRLGLSLSSAQGKRVLVMNGAGERARQVFLNGTVRGIDGGQVIGTWEQLSGPKVTFVEPRRMVGVPKKVGQVAIVPKGLRGTKQFRFAFTARADGAKVRRTVAVKVRAQRALGEVAPRYGQLQKLAKASNKRIKSAGLSQSDKDLVTVTVKPGNQVAPGKTVTLRAKAAPKIAAKVKQILWFTEEGTEETNTGLTGQTVRLKAPSQAGAGMVVTALVQLRGGREIQSSEIITTRMRQSKPLTLGDEQANIKTFCQVLDKAVRRNGSQDVVLLELPGGRGKLQTLNINNEMTNWEDSAFEGKTCTGKGTFTFEGATLEQPNGNIDDVKGKMTAADGIEIQSGVWHPTKALVDGAPPNFLKNVKVEGSAKAALDGGAWKPLTGKMKVPGKIVGPVDLDKLSLVPLPGGWHLGELSINFLNADPEEIDEILKDGTLGLQQKLSGPNEGAAALRIDSYDGKLSALHMEVANLQLGTTSGGDTWQASGTGDFMLDGTEKKVTLDITCAKGSELTDNCQVFDHFEVNGAKFYWGTEIKAMRAEAKVRYGEDRVYGFVVAGEYQSKDQWQMAVQNTDPFPLVDNIKIDSLAGKLERKPGAKEGDPAQLLGSFGGEISGMEFASGVQVDKVTGALTNACPVEENKKGCKEGEMRLAATAKVSTTFPRATSPTTLTADALVNLTTLEWTFTIGMQDVSIGPDKLNVSKAMFTLSNGSQGLCGPSDQSLDGKLFHVGFVAEANILGGTVTLGGSWASGAGGNDGQCFWGYPGKMDIGEGMNATKSLLTYATYDQTKFDLPGYAPEPIIVGKKNVMALSGQFEMNQKINDFFKIGSSKLSYRGELAVDMSSVLFEVAYDIADPGGVTLYQGDGASFGLSSVGFSVQWAYSRFDMRAFAKGNLFIRGNPQADIPDSNTPLGVSLGFSFSKDSVAFTVQAGVETEAGSIQNAFGQKDLTIRRLAIELRIAVPLTSSNFALNADADLPASWTSGAQMATKAQLALSLGKSDPCILFQLGKEGAKPSDPKVVNIGNGVVTATYLKLLIAPNGCTVPVGSTGSERLAAGYGFAFVGQVVGSNLDIVINVSFQGGFKMNGHIKTDKFDLYALAMSSYDGKDGPDITFDIDTAVKKYDITIDAAIEVGKVKYAIGGLVRVKGMVKTSAADAYEVDLIGDGKVLVGPIGAQIEKIDAHVKWYKDSSKANQSFADVSAKLKVGAMGLYIGAEGSLLYKDSQLQRLGISIETGVNLGFAKVAGMVAFDYCLGTLTLDRSKGVSSCAVFRGTVGATPAYRLSLVGKVRFLWWEDAYTWVAVDHLGTEGTVPEPAPEPEPEYIPGPTPQLEPNLMTAEVLRSENSYDVTTYYNGSTYWKAEKPAEVTDTSYGQTVKYAPCQDVVLGSTWNPTPDNPARYAGQVDPHKAPCGLIAQRVMPGSNTVLQTSLICTETECWVKGFSGSPLQAWPDSASGNYNGKATRAFRDKIIAGLRTPPGTIPAGTEFAQTSGGELQRKGYLLAPLGDYQLTFNQSSWNLQKKTNGNWDTLWYGADFGTEPFTTHAFTDKGLLTAAGKTQKMTIGVPVQKITDPSERPYLFVQDGFAVYQKQKGEATPQLIWAVNNKGNCLPDKGSCVPVCSPSTQNCKSSVNTGPDPKPQPDPPKTYTTSFRTAMGGAARCLDLPGGNTANGTQLQIWDCNRSDAQQVTVDPASQTMKIKGKCIDVRNSGTGDGTPIQIYDCNGSNAQKVVYDNRQLKVLGKCIDVNEEKNNQGQKVHLWGCHGKSNQVWDKY